MGCFPKVSAPWFAYQAYQLCNNVYQNWCKVKHSCWGRRDEDACRVEALMLWEELIFWQWSWQWLLCFVWFFPLASLAVCYSLSTLSCSLTHISLHHEKGDVRLLILMSKVSAGLEKRDRNVLKIHNKRRKFCFEKVFALFFRALQHTHWPWLRHLYSSSPSKPPWGKTALTYHWRRLFL